jgi:hypothetical protein
VEHWERNHFPQGGMLKFTYKGRFLNSIWKILGLKIRTVKTCSSASSTRANFYFWKILKSRFLVEFQNFIFGQILANLGSFGQFWADFAAMTVADSMPQLGLKS